MKSQSWSLCIGTAGWGWAAVWRPTPGRSAVHGTCCRRWTVSVPVNAPAVSMFAICSFIIHVPRTFEATSRSDTRASQVRPCDLLLRTVVAFLLAQRKRISQRSVYLYASIIIPTTVWAWLDFFSVNLVIAKFWFWVQCVLHVHNLNSWFYLYVAFLVDLL